MAYANWVADGIFKVPPPKGYHRIYSGYRRKGDIAYSFVIKKWQPATGWFDETPKGFPAKFFWWPTARKNTGK